MSDPPPTLAYATPAAPLAVPVSMVVSATLVMVVWLGLTVLIFAVASGLWLMLALLLAIVPTAEWRLLSKRSADAGGVVLFVTGIVVIVAAVAFCAALARVADQAFADAVSDFVPTSSDPSVAARNALILTASLLLAATFVFASHARFVKRIVREANGHSS